eukprot:TRINITY_DN110808_c0_g2_i1.p1 TRINITY_DN110808_c0_g2~~TRINITY_DN110808_c0_g2_i1.p1  ORF type:complete len:156 (-),score=24.46 TRINITY_DN110808_c0_g2_i1:19-486(-)
MQECNTEPINGQIRTSGLKTWSNQTRKESQREIELRILELRIGPVPRITKETVWRCSEIELDILEMMIIEQEHLIKKEKQRRKREKRFLVLKAELKNQTHPEEVRDGTYKEKDQTEIHLDEKDDKIKQSTEEYVTLGGLLVQSLIGIGEVHYAFQ